MSNKEQVLKGIVDYVDKDVITKVPTLSKWIIGAAVSMVMDNAEEIISLFQENEIIHTIGIVDDNGNIDVETVADYLTQSATKYGSVSISIPLLGNMSFSAKDIQDLKNHISRM